MNEQTKKRQKKEGDTKEKKVGEKKGEKAANE